MPPKETVAVRLNPDVKEALALRAAAERRTLSSMISIILEDWAEMEKLKKSYRKAIDQE